MYLDSFVIVDLTVAYLELYSVILRIFETASVSLITWVISNTVLFCCVEFGSCDVVKSRMDNLNN